MATTTVIDRTGKGSELTTAEMDANMDCLHGVVEAQTATTYSVTYADQGKTLECSNASPIAVTLGLAATIIAAGDTNSFHIDIVNIGVGLVTVGITGADRFMDASSSFAIPRYCSARFSTNAAQTGWDIFPFGGTLLAAINKVTITAPATNATLTLAQGSTLATSGAYSATLTSTGTTNVTLPTTGTLVAQTSGTSATGAILVGSGGGAPTYTTQTGDYARTGNVVFFRAQITLATIGTLSGDISVNIDTIRTAAGGTFSKYLDVHVEYTSRVDNSPAGGDFGCLPSATLIGIWNHGSSGAANQTTHSKLGGTATINVSGSYLVT